MATGGGGAGAVRAGDLYWTLRARGDQFLSQVTGFTRQAGAIGAGILGVQLFSGLADGILKIGRMTISANSEMQRYIASFKVLLGTEGQAAKMFEEIRKVASKTPFSTATLASSVQQLLNSGIKAKDAISTATKLGDAASASNVGLAGMPRMIVNMSQMIAMGKITGREMRDMAMLGINGWAALALQIGKTESQVKRLHAAGKLGANQVQDLIDGLGKKYAGQMKLMSRTWEGMWETFQDTARMAIADISGPLFRRLSKAFEKVIDFLETPAWERWVRRATLQVEILAIAIEEGLASGKIQKALRFTALVAGAIVAATSAMALSVTVGVLSAALRRLALMSLLPRMPLIGLGISFQWVATAAGVILRPLRLAGAAIGLVGRWGASLLAPLGAVVAAFGGLGRVLFGGVLSALGATNMAILSLGRIIVTSLTAAVPAAIASLGTVFTHLLATITPFASVVVRAFTTFGGYILSTFPMIGAAISGVGSIAASVFSGLGSAVVATVETFIWFGGVIVNVVSRVIGVIPLAGTAITWLARVATTAGSVIASAIGTIATSLAGLLGSIGMRALTFLGSALTSMVPIVTSMVTSVAAAFGWMTSAIAASVASIGTLFAPIVAFVGRLGASIGTLGVAFTGLFGRLLTPLRMFGGVFVSLGPAISSLLAPLGALLGPLMSIFSVVGGLLTSTLGLTAIFAALGAIVYSAFAANKPAMDMMLQTLSEIWILAQEVFDNLVDIVGEAFTTISEWWWSLWGSDGTAGNAITETTNGVLLFVRDMLEWVSLLTTNWRDGWELLKMIAAQKLLEITGKVINSGGEWLATFVGLLNALGSIFSTFWSQLKAMFQEVGNLAAAAWAGIKEAWEKGKDTWSPTEAANAFADAFGKALAGQSEPKFKTYGEEAEKAFREGYNAVSGQGDSYLKDAESLQSAIDEKKESLESERGNKREQRKLERQNRELKAKRNIASKNEDYADKNKEKEGQKNKGPAFIGIAEMSKHIQGAIHKGADPQSKIVKNTKDIAGASKKIQEGIGKVADNTKGMAPAVGA